MTTKSHPHWLWAKLDAALRSSTMRSDEATLFAARLVAWHLLPTRVSVPESLIPPEAGTPLSGDYLDVAWGALEVRDALGSLRFAFAARSGNSHLHISDKLLSQLNDSLVGLIRLSDSDRRAFAVELVRRLVDAQNLGYYDLPLEVSDFVIQLVGPKKDEPIFCPGPAADSLAISAMRVGARPSIFSPLPPLVASLYAVIVGGDMDVVHRDPYKDSSLGNEPNTVFRIGALKPPFGTRIAEELRAPGWLATRFGVQSLEAYGVELGLRCARERVAIVVPNRFLFGGGADGKFREHLVQAGVIDTVISFPPGLLGGTNMPFSVLLLRPSKKATHITFCKVDDEDHIVGRGNLRAHGRRFSGAEEILKALETDKSQFVVHVPTEHVKAQDSNLTVDRYIARPLEMLSRPDRKMVRLGDLVEIVKPQFIKADDSSTGLEVQEAVPGDIPSYGYLMSVPRLRRVDASVFASRSKQILKNGDVLLSTKGTIGTVGVAKPDPQADTPLLPSQASVILRLKEDREIEDPRYLAIYLRSPSVQAALAALATGGTIPNISLGDLRALPVWVPTHAEQGKFVELFDQQTKMQQQIEELTHQQHSLADSAWRAAGLALPVMSSHTRKIEAS